MDRSDEKLKEKVASSGKRRYKHLTERKRLANWPNGRENPRVHQKRRQ